MLYLYKKSLFHFIYTIKKLNEFDMKQIYHNTNLSVLSLK